MGVFLVVGSGAACVSRSSEKLVSYRWAPKMALLSYLVQMTDAGLVPCCTTNNETPTVLGWGFSRPIAPVPACRAGSCGLRQPPESAVPDSIPLSPGYFSLRPWYRKPARSPQRPNFWRILITGLCADESSGWSAASGGGGNAAGPVAAAACAVRVAAAPMS